MTSAYTWPQIIVESRSDTTMNYQGKKRKTEQKRHMDQGNRIKGP